MKRLHKRLSIYCYSTFEIWGLLNYWDDKKRKRYYKNIYPVKTLITVGVKHFKNVVLISHSYGQLEYVKMGITIEWLHITFI